MRQMKKDHQDRVELDTADSYSDPAEAAYYRDLRSQLGRGKFKLGLGRRGSGRRRPGARDGILRPSRRPSWDRDDWEPRRSIK